MPNDSCDTQESLYPFTGSKVQGFIAAAGGQLLGVAFSFIGEIFSGKEETEQTIQMAEAFKNRLAECLEKGDDGQLKMTITLPDESALDGLAKSLAQMLNTGG